MVTKLERVCRNAFNDLKMYSTLHWFVVQQERVGGGGNGMDHSTLYLCEVRTHTHLAEAETLHERTTTRLRLSEA